MKELFTQADMIEAMFIGFCIGFLLCIVAMWTLTDIKSNRERKYKELIIRLQSLIKMHGIVTLTDMVLETKLKPTECRKFLNRLVAELDADVGYTESGKIYYQFPVAKSLKAESEEND